jgi:hypothetical protein
MQILSKDVLLQHHITHSYTSHVTIVAINEMTTKVLPCPLTHHTSNQVTIITLSLSRKLFFTEEEAQYAKHFLCLWHHGIVNQ